MTKIHNILGDSWEKTENTILDKKTYLLYVGKLNLNKILKNKKSLKKKTYLTFPMGFNSDIH